MKERLQKLLSARGVASRRHAEELIAGGRVTVNGRTASVGDGADPDTDVVFVDGKPLPAAPAAFCYIALHKPAGYVTTLSDERGRRTVGELTRGAGTRLFPVGRLDLNSSGLLFMTNDGDVAYRLTHPSHEVDKEYHVTVGGDARAAMPVLTSALELDGYRIRPASVRILRADPEGALLSVTIHEGRNRQVRRMCEAAGLTVRRLSRVRIGRIRLEGLAPGQWRYLTDAEAAYLKSL